MFNIDLVVGINMLSIVKRSTIRVASSMLIHLLLEKDLPVFESEPQVFDKKSSAEKNYSLDSETGQIIIQTFTGKITEILELPHDLLGKEAIEERYKRTDSWWEILRKIGFRFYIHWDGGDYKEEDHVEEREQPESSARFLEHK